MACPQVEKKAVLACLTATGIPRVWTPMDMNSTKARTLSRRQCVDAVLHRIDPGRFVYAPNFWQWFGHHRNHGTLPAELSGCSSQLDMIRFLELDVFSRNVYCDQRRYWFGGMAEPVYDGITASVDEHEEGPDSLIERSWQTPAGQLRERQRYVFSESTLVQESFAVEDYTTELDAFEQLVRARRWHFRRDLWEAWVDKVGEDGFPVAGELFSPLKMLHLAMGPEHTTFFLEDEPDRAAAILEAHEQAQLDLVAQMAEAGVRVMMAMDNLDTVFHTPDYVERYSASFYTKAAALCHERGSALFIHACGRQRGNLARIASYGVDGLEGVAFPPLGDVQLEEALAMTGDRFIVTGGISAMETMRLGSRQQVFDYVGALFERLQPYRNRFILAASCNTAIAAPWETLVHFRDAWRELQLL